MAEDLKEKAAEVVRKVLTVGIGAAFLTEESLRGLMADFKLPKELLGGILESANKTKNDFFQGLSREIVSRVSERIDPSALLKEVLEQHEIELNVKLNFRPKKKSKASGD
jgi:hypothetical protein